MDAYDLNDSQQQAIRSVVEGGADVSTKASDDGSARPSLAPPLSPLDGANRDSHGGGSTSWSPGSNDDDREEGSTKRGQVEGFAPSMEDPEAGAPWLVEAHSFPRWTPTVIGFEGLAHNVKPQQLPHESEVR